MKKLNIKSIFYYNLFSYISIVLVSITIVGFTYIKAQKAIEQEALRANMAVFERACSYIDSQMNQASNLISSIALNQRIDSFIYRKAPLSESVRYNLLNTINEMSIYKYNLQFISDFYIYFKESDTILSPTGKYAPELFFKYIYNYSNMDFANWNDHLFGKYQNGKDIIMQSINSTLPENNALTIMQSLPTGEVNNPLATLVVMIDTQKIHDLLEDIKWMNSGTIYIVDDNGNTVLSHGNDVALPVSAVNSLTGNNGILHMDIEDTNMAVSYVASDFHGWMYISLVPSDLYVTQTTYIKNIALLNLALSLLFGVIIALIFSYRNYYPVKKIINMFFSKGKPTHDYPFNEYEYIAKNIYEEREEDKRVHELLDEQRPIIRNNILHRILSGRMLYSSSELEYLEKYDITFLYNSFIVLVLYLGSLDSFAEGYSEDEWSVLRLKIIQYCNSSKNAHMEYYSIEVDHNRIILLINFERKPDEQVKNEVNAIASSVSRHTSEKHNISCNIGVGSIRSKISNISKSYIEASRALDYGIAKANDKVVWYEDIAQFDQRQFYPVAIEQQIVNYARVGDYARIEKLIEYIYIENLSKRKLSLVTIKYLFYDLQNTIIKIVDNLNLDNEKVFTSGLDPIECMTECITIDEMKITIKNIFENICKYINKNKTSHSDRLAEKITEYLNNNFASPDISLTLVSDHFKITPQYLSRFFKEQTGENLMEHINKLRIDKAKVLLQDSELSIENIAKKVGYYNSITLLRTFKKFNGTSPSAYRENLINNIK